MCAAVECWRASERHWRFATAVVARARSPAQLPIIYGASASQFTGQSTASAASSEPPVALGLPDLSLAQPSPCLARMASGLAAPLSAPAAAQLRSLLCCCYWRFGHTIAVLGCHATVAGARAGMFLGSGTGRHLRPCCSSML